MSKSKDCEQLRAERDHWRGRAVALAEQVEALQNELERTRIYSEAFRGGMATIDQSIQQLQAERNNWRGQVQIWEAVVNHYHAQTQHEAQQAFELARAMWEQQAGVTSLSASVVGRAVRAAFWHAIYLIDGSFVANWQERSIALHGQLPARDPEMAIMSLFRNAGMIAVFAMTLEGARQALEMSQDPNLICALAISELNSRGDVASELLAELPQPWIDEYLRAGLSPATLREGLVLAHKAEHDGRTLPAVAADLLVSERNLKRYRSWYNTMQEAGRSMPEYLGWILETEKGTFWAP